VAEERSAVFVADGVDSILIAWLVADAVRGRTCGFLAVKEDVAVSQWTVVAAKCRSGWRRLMMLRHSAAAAYSKLCHWSDLDRCFVLACIPLHLLFFTSRPTSKLPLRLMSISCSHG
jgi:hypothetical protein